MSRRLKSLEWGCDKVPLFTFSSILYVGQYHRTPTADFKHLNLFVSLKNSVEIPYTRGCRTDTFIVYKWS